MADYKTFNKEKILYFIFSIVAYFLPFIIVTAVFLPIVKTVTGFKIALGLCIVVINSIPFIMGVFRAFFSHFPMFNLLAIVFLFLAAFFTLDLFRDYKAVFCWIELAAAVGSIISCVFWSKYLKYKLWSQSVKANVKSGAFIVKEEK